MVPTANIFAWIDISSDTRIRYQISDGNIDFILDTSGGGVELAFDHLALKRFLEIASAALTNSAPRPTLVGTAT